MNKIKKIFLENKFAIFSFFIIILSSIYIGSNIITLANKNVISHPTHNNCQGAKEVRLSNGEVIIEEGDLRCMSVAYHQQLADDYRMYVLYPAALVTLYTSILFIYVTHKMLKTRSKKTSPKNRRKQRK